jgi:hypothetical protein
MGLTWTSWSCTPGTLLSLRIDDQRKQDIDVKKVANFMIVQIKQLDHIMNDAEMNRNVQ